MSSKITLYDLPTRFGTPWSLNPWKTRMILNYKKIEYETEWIEFPDLAPKLTSYGILPNDSKAPGYWADYTSPTVRHKDGAYTMDSWLIVQELEKLHPSPPLHLNDPIVVQMRDHVDKLLGPLIPHLVPKTPLLMNKVSADYVYEVKAKQVGMSLHDLANQATEENWKNAEAPAKEVGNWLRANGGPFFLGETVSYADFIFVAVLQCLKCIDEAIFQRYMQLDSAFPKVYEASKEWLQKVD